MNVNAGTVHLDAGQALGPLAAVNLAHSPGVALTITGTQLLPGGETIGSLSGGGQPGRKCHADERFFHRRQQCDDNFCRCGLGPG